jgi:hypothetical protein
MTNIAHIDKTQRRSQRLCRPCSGFHLAGVRVTGKGGRRAIGTPSCWSATRALLCQRGASGEPCHFNLDATVDELGGREISEQDLGTGQINPLTLCHGVPRCGDVVVMSMWSKWVKGSTSVLWMPLDLHLSRNVRRRKCRPGACFVYA